MKQKPRLWLWIAIGVLVIVLVPLAMDWLIIGNNFPTNIDNADWVGFFGGYIGAIVGAIVSLVGIVITIRHTSQENRRDRELQIRPYCMVQPIAKEQMNQQYLLDCMSFDYNPQNIEITDFFNRSEAKCRIEIKNIGIGPAVDVEIRQEQHCFYSSKEKTELNYYNMTRCNCIPSHESIYVVFSAFYSQKMVSTNSKWSRHMDNAIDIFHSEYPECTVPFTVKYTDLLGTQYTQSFSLAIRFAARTSADKKEIIDGVSGHVYIKNRSIPELDDVSRKQR